MFAVAHKCAHCLSDNVSQERWRVRKTARIQAVGRDVAGPVTDPNCGWRTMTLAGDTERATGFLLRKLHVMPAGHSVKRSQDVQFCRWALATPRVSWRALRSATCSRWALTPAPTGAELEHTPFKARTRVLGVVENLPSKPFCCYLRRCNPSADAISTAMCMFVLGPVLVLLLVDGPDISHS